MPLSAHDQALVDAASGSATPPPTTPIPPVPKPTAPAPVAGPGPNAPHKMTNPLAPLVPVLTGAARAAGTVVNPIFDIITRPNDAVKAGLSSGDPRNAAQTLIHGQSQESRDTTRADVRKQMGAEGDQPSPLYRLLGMHAAPEGQHYSQMPHAEQGFVDVGVDTGTDPWTALGGMGIMEHIAEAAGARLTPLFARAVKTAIDSTRADAPFHAGDAIRAAGAKVAPAITRGAQSSNPLVRAASTKVGSSLKRAVDAAANAANTTVHKAGKIAEGAYNATHYKGQQLLDLAAQNGEQGVDQFRGLKAINNARLTQNADLTRSLTDKFHKVIKGLSEQDEAELYNAIHTGTVESLDPLLQQRAKEFKQVTDSMAHLAGTNELQAQLAEHGFGLPPDLERFLPQTERSRDLQDVGEFRQNYVPTKHVDRHLKLVKEPGIADLDEATTRGGEASLEDVLRNPNEPREAPKTEGVNSHDPNLEQRGEGAQLLAPELQRKVIENRLRNGANAISARDAEIRVAQLFGKDTFSKVPPEAQEFFRETYTRPEDRQWWQHVADGWKGAIDIPKTGMFALPFRHMANIYSLAVLADPSLAATSLGKFARLMVAGANPEVRAKILGQAGKFGVTGTPSLDKNVAGWLGKIPGIGDIYRASNHALWTFDDAVKAQRFQNLVTRFKGQGLDETTAAYRAADRVGAELIDYSNRSPVTQALSYVAPFAAYRGSVPKAVGRALVRHTERVELAGRASPELVGDEQEAPGTNAYGDPNVGKSQLPLPEVLRGAVNPMEFARSTLGYPIRGAISLAGEKLGEASGYPEDPTADYMTYGKKVGSPQDALKLLLNSTVGSFPGGDFALDKTGLGQFQSQGDVTGSLGKQTGFSIGSGPSPSQQEAKIRSDLMQHQADEAARTGNTELAKAILAARARYLRDHRLYVP